MLDVHQIIQESADLKSAMLSKCANDIQSAAEMMIDAVINGNFFLWRGNGGSAADAQHMVPSNDTQRIQEGHLLTEHILCELVEAAIMDQ